MKKSHVAIASVYGGIIQYNNWVKFPNYSKAPVIDGYKLSGCWLVDLLKFHKSLNQSL